jgi:hypothetical protein
MQLKFNFIETVVIKFLTRSFASNTARSWLIKYLTWSITREESLTCMTVCWLNSKREVEHDHSFYFFLLI